MPKACSWMTDRELDDIISRASKGLLDDKGVATLAGRLADSGETVSFGHSTADLASTGGPSSLSTLLGPLFLRSMGLTVPSLGVPGRPAGGVDVLAQIPGYRTDLSPEEIGRIIETCGYAHFESGRRLAPLDAQLFKYRQAVGAQAVTPLVIASLLAKKIAVGVQRVGLDVRVAAHGNFGRTNNEARDNAARFCRVAKILGLQPTCILTDASRPYQPFIGRREALVGVLRVLDGRAEGLLERHAAECVSMAQATAGDASCMPVRSDVKAAFHANVTAQGGGAYDFDEFEREVLARHRHFIMAESDGYLSFDLERLRKTLIDRQAADAEGHPYPDPVGLILLRDSGQLVTKGETVMTVRALENLWPLLSDELAQAVSVSSEPEPLTALGEIIHG